MTTTIALGNGLFLANLPSQVRGLYPENDPRKGSAYNIYYVGINLGAILSPPVCTILGVLYGWHWGFAAAGVGTCVGLAIYIFGGRWLPVEPLPPRKRARDPSEAPVARGTVPLLLGVGLAVVVFRGAYEQMGNTIILWTRQAKQKREPSALTKMSLGALGLAAAYLLLIAAAGFAGNLLAGVLGAFWSQISHEAFFGLMAGVALVSALMLLALKIPARRLGA